MFSLRSTQYFEYYQMDFEQNFVFQGEESRGYQELVAAAKRVDSVPVAICMVKEVWADYSISSDTMVLFRKVPFSCITTADPCNTKLNEADDNDDDGDATG